MFERKTNINSMQFVIKSLSNIQKEFIVANSQTFHGLKLVKLQL